MDTTLTRPEPGARVRLTDSVMTSVGSEKSGIVPGAEGTVIEKPEHLLEVGYVHVELDGVTVYPYVLLLPAEIEVIA